MTEIYFIDTCVLLEILKVPNRYTELKSKEHSRKLADISIKPNTIIIMPISVIIETGNFINHIKNKHYKQGCLEKFIDILTRIKNEDAPWIIYGYEYFENDLTNIIDTAILHSPSGLGIGDAFILESFNRYKENLEPKKSYSIEIWSDDVHLNSYSETV